MNYVNIFNQFLDFVFSLPSLFAEIGNILFSPFVNLVEGYLGFDIPQNLQNLLGDISLIGMFSVSFILTAITFKLIALFVPN